jgi:hypothetical protein
MGTPLRVLAFFLLAVLVIAAAREGGAPRRPLWSLISTGSIDHADLPDASSTLDASAGRLSIPNAALEPVGWGDLDGWTSDDHTVAFATFNASCRAVVRAVVFRAESETDHTTDPQPVRAALEQECTRAIKAGGLGPSWRGSSSGPISFRCESANSEILQALSLVITIQS